WVSAHCGPGKPWAYKDVAVLLRSAAPLSALLEAFKARGLPYAVEMERFFYGAQEIIDLVNLLRTLDDPGDRLALAGLLRSPTAALKDSEVYQLARARGLTYLKDPPAVLAAEPLARVRLLYACLRSLRQRVGRAPLGELVQAALRETPLLETAARAYHGQQTVSNLLKFGRLAASAADDRGMTLKEFIERLRQDREEGRQEGESPLADEHLDAVRILSIHKSKGLEFPVVLLMNLSGSRGGAGRSKAALVDWESGRCGLRLRGAGADASMALIEAREKRRQGDEALRLLYVALTRAKEKLILLGGESGDRTALSSLLSRARGWPTERGQAGVLPKGLMKPLPVRWTAPAAGLVRVSATGGGLKLPQPMPPAADLAAVWRGRLERARSVAATVWTTSPTAYLKEVAKDPAWEPGAPAPVTGAAAALVGQLCHRVLEGWDFAGVGDCAAAVDAARRALRHSQPEADWEAAASEGRIILEGFLASSAARELAKAEILGREVPFLYEADGAVMRGSIDLLYRKDGKTIVADYKTDEVEPAELEKRREKYHRQGRAYCRAVERALGLKDVGFRLIFLRG
ncbi:MAG: 3'-5' exonuclease, partial [Elusimicrobiota bacterium]